MKAISEEYRKLERIVRSRIPVSEDSPVYDLFAARRKLAEKLRNNMLTEEARAYMLESFYHIEDNIKKFLCL